MIRVAAATVAAGALLAGVLLPTALAAPPTVVVPETSAPKPPPGAKCEWGTATAGSASLPPTTRGYLRGDDWRRDHEPPVECAIGPTWTPLVQHYPYSKVIAQSGVSGRGVAMALCAGVRDPRCNAGDWKQLLTQSVMDHCDQASDFNCIESLEVIDAQGAVQRATYLRGFPETPKIPEFRGSDAFVPAGGSVPLWEYSTGAGTARILTMGMTTSTLRSAGSKWVQQPGDQFTFALVPVRIESRPGVPKPGMVEQIDPSTGLTGVNRTGWGDPSTQGCAAFDTGECAVDVPFPADHRFRVTLRMRDTASMYLNGAVDEPVAYSDKIDGGHRFVLEAAPSPVIGMAGWIPKSAVPRTVIDNAFAAVGNSGFWDIDFDAASFRSLGRGGTEPLAWLKALLPYFGDRATFIVDAWYVENTPSLGQYTSRCVDKGTGEFIGIVSSNATAYTGDPPAYDARTGTLRYEVAGPHYMPDGVSLNKGRYSINMKADFVTCLLGVEKVPSQARVELIYPDGEASAATLAVKQDKNWLRLYYENFTFSSPTVSVQFPKSLTCFKGKGKRVQSKTFVAFECPKGWRAKR
jgi:hypothetical protein